MELQKAFEHYYNYLKGKGSSASHLRTVKVRLNRFIMPSEKYPYDNRSRNVRKIRRHEIHEHFELMESNDLADGTLAGYSTAHRSFWTFCKRSRWIKKSPAKKLKRYSYEPVHNRAAPAVSVDKVTAALPGFAIHRNHPADVRDALFVSLVLDGGGRLGEYHTLRSLHLKAALENGIPTESGEMIYIIVGSGKTGSKLLFFFEQTARLAKMWLDRTSWPESDYVFISTKSEALLKPNSLGRSFERVCKYAGVPVFRAHSVRKRNVTDIIKLAGDWKMGQLYAGHKSINVTMKHYNDLYIERVAEVASEMAAKRRQRAKYAVGMHELFGNDYIPQSK